MMTEPQFNRYSIALFDFDKAAEYAEGAARHCANTLEHEALIFAAIMCYCRPFSTNERSKDPPAVQRLTLEDFATLSLSEQERNLHDECRKLRNQALAHSEWNRNPTKFNKPSGVISSRPFSLFTNRPDIQALANLSKRLAHECHNKRADYVSVSRYAP